jgi:hypothetical protein
VFKKLALCLALVAHAYNPSYLEGRHQEDCSLRPVWAKIETLSQKIPNTKRFVEWLKWQSAYLGIQDLNSDTCTTNKQTNKTKTLILYQHE